MNPTVLWRVIGVLDAFCIIERVAGRAATFGGDIDIGGLRGSGQPDLLLTPRLIMPTTAAA